MPYITPLKADYSKDKYTNAAGNAECVEFVRQTTKAPSTSNWIRGPKVKDIKPGCLPPGTAIATFDEKGNYPTDEKGRHAAIYRGHSESGVEVFDQWRRQGQVKPRTIRFLKDNELKTSRSNDANDFYVIVGSSKEADAYSKEMSECADKK